MAAGIFRINADNNQEEHLRNRLNSGMVPDGIDAWFRELPTRIWDPLSPEQVMQCQSEENCTALCLLPPTETALLDWAIKYDLDGGSVERLMYVVQVMNFLKTLILKTLREQDSAAESSQASPRESPLDENSDQGPGMNPHAQQNLDEKRVDMKMIIFET
ncbi:putative Rho GTPase activation protein [Helianthus annuus]|nr:putative Rho GTPase activation protein [Helianthus annuus]KAJ0954786.1 putative Rho GTPase activation protein [Helianthus annuus]